MEVKALSAFADNYIWILIDPSTQSFDCVDPGDAAVVLSYAKKSGLYLRNIYITHHHPDHIGGVGSLFESFPNSHIYAPDDPRILIRTHSIQPEETIKTENYQLQCLSTPGHTSSHVSYFEPQFHWLFCGDTLFSAGCGRVFDGTMEDLYHSIEKLKQLPEDSSVFCAHEYTENNLKFAHTVESTNRSIEEYLRKFQAKEIDCSLPSTIGLEKKINPFMRLNSPEVKRYAELHHHNAEDPLAVFSLLRKQKDCF